MRRRNDRRFSSNVKQRSAGREIFPKLIDPPPAPTRGTRRNARSLSPLGSAASRLDRYFLDDLATIHDVIAGSLSRLRKLAERKPRTDPPVARRDRERERGDKGEGEE